MFSSLGVPIIDSDTIAREVVEPGEPGLEQVITRFGDDVLNPDCTLNRQRLRNIVFGNTDARKDLEQILHPLIRKRSNEYLEELSTPYAILSIPLLIEAGLTSSVDRILVVDCPEHTQIERICNRDGISPDKARAILASQCSRNQRLSVADDILDNDQPLEEIKQRVESLHNSYLSLAQKT